MEYRRKQMKLDKKRIREHLPEDLRDEDIDEEKEEESLRWWQLVFLSRFLDKTDRQRQIGI